jgi:hypothetical protein
MTGIMGYTDEDSETAVFLALGAASTCWDEAGVFQSERAKQVGDELIEHLRHLRLLPERTEP